MTETMRTLMFAVVAGVSVLVAVVTHFIARPTPIEGFEKVGQEFYPDFEDPNEATTLRVAAFVEDTASNKEFKVEFKEGNWRIPSHHDYPADAEDRLGKTAASVIGITRGALESRLESEYEKYGVIDPIDEDSTALKGRGQRITLNKADGTVLADYIIGKKVEGQDGSYFVRIPLETETYRTKLNIDLSTKFSDWIEPDLLKLERDTLTNVVINNYSIDERQRRIIDRAGSKLTRKLFSDPWKLEGLDEEKEELKEDEIRTMVNNLADLKIVGVRPKPQGLNADFTLDAEVVRNPLLLATLSASLESKGFLLVQDEKQNLSLVSNEGEVTAATNEGIVYSLHFGEIFSGDETEIEIGSTFEDEEAEKNGDENDADNKKEDQNQNSDEPKSNDGQEAKDSRNKQQDLKKSRYLFVRVSFDPSSLGEEPQKPEKPQDAHQPGSDEKNSNGEKNSNDEKNGNDAEDGNDPEAAFQKLMAEYQQDLKKHHKKIEDGRQKVSDLNDRFEAWYYVISAESFENLRLARKDLVKPKQTLKEDKQPENSRKPVKAVKPSANGNAGGDF